MSVSRDTAILHQAIELGNESEILKLLQEKILNLNETRENGDFSIHEMILQNENFGTENDVIELLEALLDRGVDPNIQNWKQQTILRLAVKKRCRNVVDLLIRQNADILMCDKDGYSIAWFFVEDEYDKFYKLLPFNEDRFRASQSEIEKLETESANFAEWMISKGFDFDQKNNRGVNALCLSIKYNLHHISLVLLKHSQDINFIDDSGQTLLHLFIEECFHMSVLKYLQNPKNVLGSNWISDYISRYAARIVKILLEKGVDSLAVDKFSRTSLLMAIEFVDDQNIIEIIIEHSLKKCDKNIATAMLMELMKVRMDWKGIKTDYFLNILSQLLAKGADVNTKNENGFTPLYYALYYRNQQAVDFLNDHGADFSVINKYGKNLLYALVRRYAPDELSPNEETVLERLFDLLVSKGCDLNVRNVDNKTLLHFDSPYVNLSIVRKLIDNGAEVDCKDKCGMTPLHSALFCNLSENIIELLLESGANVNFKDSVGLRPLNLGIFRNNQLVKMLLKWGAYVNSYVAKSKSPFFQAIEKNHLDNTNEMLAYGADINDQRIINLLVNKDVDLPTMKAVVQHWVKLKVLGLACCDNYKDFVDANEYQRLFQECSTEIEKLKNTFIDSHTSIYTFLRVDVGSRCIHINNEKLKHLIGSPKLEQQFPQYFVLILASYRETVAWRKLLEPGKRAWRELIKVTLPEECIERVFAYLRVADLVIMAEYEDDL